MKKESQRRPVIVRKLPEVTYEATSFKIEYLMEDRKDE